MQAEPVTALAMSAEKFALVLSVTCVHFNSFLSSLFHRDSCWWKGGLRLEQK